MQAAKELRQRLEERGFTLWQDLIALEGGLEWWAQIEQAIKSPSRFLLSSSAIGARGSGAFPARRSQYDPPDHDASIMCCRRTRLALSSTRCEPGKRSLSSFRNLHPLPPYQLHFIDVSWDGSIFQSEKLR